MSDEMTDEELLAEIRERYKLTYPNVIMHLVDRIALLETEKDTGHTLEEMAKACREKLNEPNAALVGLAKVKEQLASCAAGPWVEYNTEMHTDYTNRLLKFEGRSLPVVAKWLPMSGWVDTNGNIASYGIPTHVAELCEFKNTCANTKGDQSDGPKRDPKRECAL